jgi:E3 ubiquitin-protein ligase MARCH6
MGYWKVSGDRACLFPLYDTKSVVVIGLIGPVSNLFQNVIFAAVIIAAAQTIFVGLPMIGGKLFLCTDILGVGLWVIRNVLRAIRLVTDPLVDVTLEITRDVILAPALSSFKGLEGVVARKFGLTLPSPTIPPFSMDTLFSTNTTTSNSTISTILSKVSGGVQNGYTPGAILNNLVPSLATTSGRLLCMATGYSIVTIVLIVTLALNEFGVVDFTFGLVRGEVKQYLLFGKLALFMLIELVVFPMGIGMILGGCVFPLLDGGGLRVLSEMFKMRVFGGVFLSWLCGTM